jgi:adenosine deaminase
MSRFPAEFIKAIPKTDLHLHLDGSLRINTLIELANKAAVPLPAQDEKGLREKVFKDQYQNLEEYLQGFALTTAVMQNEEALFRVSYELMIDNAAEGVRYIEVRFAPQLLMSDAMSFHQVMESVDRGLRQACDELNAAKNPEEPVYNYGIIACAMRFFTGDFSPWYRDFCRAHAFSTPTEIIRAASLELAKGVIRLRTETPIQIVGFDIAGAENGFPAIEHAESYALIQKGMLGKTVHAGEAFGPKSILQAVAKLRTDRIGHGLRLFDEEMIQPQKVANRAAYIESLVNYIADRRIAIEVCLTSNMQTSPEIGELRNHALRKMLDHNLAVTLCTDNRLVSNTTVCREYELALDNFAIDAKCLRDIVMWGFKRCFYYRPYGEKRALISRVSDYYDTLAQKFGINH